MLRPRLLFALSGLALAVGGCGYTPKQLGITGPGSGQTPVASHASEADMDSYISDPGLPAGFGDPYATYNSPGEEPRRFFGYN